MTETHEARVWDMMNNLDFCMFVTQSHGTMRGRPMSSIVKPDEKKIYFLSDKDGAKDDELAKSNAVCLTYANGGSKFLSVSGKAEMNTDTALIERLWNPGAQAFWPEGPRSGKVYAIVVDPVDAEYWDGSSGLVAAAKFMFALATRSQPDLGESAKVKL
ncbi:MAG: pyridoxamine 5'-phosphate oxidase family protein [Beijerinckiaceae bacterium]